ncbi:hypothetical protein HJG60_011825 [Phyllostomus discolor]|uniref:Uncharacterized protein n=1 Tax=Phyllostomus discolor TaxID=89673 RepID=A0A833ZL71_9CHIR|nr:hypothetical protein HJG60_011825 [Phyllostomus discolor]
MREQYWEPWERRWVIPFPLDLKAQHGLWDQRSKMRPAEDLWSGGGRRGKEQPFNSASFPFQKSKAGRPLESFCWPSAPPILKIGGLIHPRERRDCHTGAEGPRGCWESCSFPEPSIPKGAQKRGLGGGPDLLIVHRGLSARVPGKEIHQN